MDPYSLLGIAADATPGQLSAAHRRAVLESHPDLGGEPEDFILVQRAFEVLSNPRSRAWYDCCGIAEVIDLRDPPTTRDYVGVTTAARMAPRSAKPWRNRLSPLRLVLPVTGAVLFYLPQLSHLDLGEHYAIFMLLLLGGAVSWSLSRETELRPRK